MRGLVMTHDFMAAGWMERLQPDPVAGSNEDEMLQASLELFWHGFGREYPVQSHE